MERTPLTLSHVEQVEDALQARFTDAQGSEAPFSALFRLAGDGLLVYLVPADGVPLPAVELFGEGLEMRAEDEGEALVPVRMGLLIPARGDQPFDLQLGTYEYEGVHMAMVGLFKSGAALMATWGDPYVTLCLAREGLDDGAQLLTSFRLGKTARGVQLRCLGPGDLTALVQAYRQQAEALGYRVTWEEKLAKRPQATKLFGACNFKLWHALARRYR